MGFDLIAKNLLKEIPKEPSGPVSSKEDIIEKLRAAGFDHDSVFNEMRNLMDTTEDDTIKKGIMDMIIKIYGMYVTKETERLAPTININIKGENNKIFRMLCPPVEQAA